MPNNLRFWTNVGLIAAAHLAVIYGLIHWSREDKTAPSQSVVWMSGGAGDGIVLQKEKPLHESASPRTESRREKSSDDDQDRPILTSAPSEIQLPTPKPSPKGSATPKAKATPKPAPKPTAKKTVAKAKPLPKPKRKADEKEELASKIEKPAPENKKIVLAKNEIVEKKPAEKSAATQTGSGKGATAGTGGGRAGGSVNEAEFGWYGSMLHDRFYSEWAQPASLANSGGKNSVLVKLRIEKDGRVSSFEIVRSSGNEELDNSVKALAGRVSQVDPLPDGLGRGDHYDVKINFELNSE